MNDRQITVEFFGVPRQRAGCASTLVAARTVAEALVAVEKQHPGLRGLLGADGSVAAQYRVSIDGQQFITRPDVAVQPTQHILILSADAGG